MARSVPLYLAVCLSCKDSKTSPDWDQVARWQRYHLNQPGHTVTTAQTSISTSFVTAMKGTERTDDDQPEESHG